MSRARIRGRLRRLRPAGAVVALALVALAATGHADDSRRAVVHGPGGRPASSPYAPQARLFSLDHGAGEPTIGFTAKGTLLVTASDGCVTSCVGSTETTGTVAPGGRAVLASADGGATWEDRSPGVAGVSPHAFSLDPYLYVDPATSRVFDVDLTLACAELSYSDDEGRTWVTNPAACGEPVNDHQTVFAGPPVTSPTVGYPNVVYYCFNHPIVTKCNKSLNGGLTFTTTTDLLGPACGGLNGHGVTDAEGTIYLPLAVCGRPTLAVSRDEGSTWSTVEVADLSGDGGGDPSVAVDEDGTLYFLFVDGERRLPHLVTSRDAGASWSAPMPVAPSGVRAANLATLDVGRPGRVAIAYYGTTTASADRWNGYLASGIGVLGESPTFFTATVSAPGHPLKAGDCGPGRCGRVLDFIDVEIAPDGAPWGAYVDACAGECERTGVESIQDNNGLVGSLVGGPSLR